MDQRVNDYAAPFQDDNCFSDLSSVLMIGWNEDLIFIFLEGNSNYCFLGTEHCVFMMTLMTTALSFVSLNLQN